MGLSASNSTWENVRLPKGFLDSCKSCDSDGKFVNLLPCIVSKIEFYQCKQVKYENGKWVEVES